MKTENLPLLFFALFFCFFWMKLVVSIRNQFHQRHVQPNDVPRDFGPVVAFGAKSQIPVVRP